MTEIKQAQGRTWFLTLTLSPQAHSTMANRARLRLAGQGIDFDTLPHASAFAERNREVGREITLYLKRIRKESASALRYCLVAEAHKSGLPHYHALVHEVDFDNPVRASTLKGQWKLGFSQCKLVAQGDERRTANYVAKYLSKDAASRVRASAGYGHQPDEKSPFSRSRPQGIATLVALNPSLTHNPTPSDYSDGAIWDYGQHHQGTERVSNPSSCLVGNQPDRLSETGADLPRERSSIRSAQSTATQSDLPPPSGRPFIRE